MDHVRTPSDVAFRLTHSGSPALRPFHGLWPRLGCCSPLAVRPRPFHGLWPRLGCCAPLAARRRLVASPRRRRWAGLPLAVVFFSFGHKAAGRLGARCSPRSWRGTRCWRPRLLRSAVATPPSATWAAAALTDSPAALDGVAGWCRSRPHAGTMLSLRRWAGSAGAQGCLAPRAAGWSSALGASAWGWGSSQGWAARN